MCWPISEGLHSPRIRDLLPPSAHMCLPSPHCIALMSCPLCRCSSHCPHYFDDFKESTTSAWIVFSCIHFQRPCRLHTSTLLPTPLAKPAEQVNLVSTSNLSPCRFITPFMTCKIQANSEYATLTYLSDEHSSVRRSNACQRQPSCLGVWTSPDSFALRTASRRLYDNFQPFWTPRCQHSPSNYVSKRSTDSLTPGSSTISQEANGQAALGRLCCRVRASIPRCTWMYASVPK